MGRSIANDWASSASLCLFLLAFAGSACAKDLCGRPEESPDALFARLAEGEKLPETYRDESFVALNDAGAQTVWTFTIAGHPAHPSVVCRRPVQDGGKLSLEMHIRCTAREAACVKLVRSFQDLNQRMIEAMKEQRK